MTIATIAQANMNIPSSSQNSNIFTSLNEEQRQAVMHINGPLLVLAGAGTGKTRVLTMRIANMLMHGVFPRQILAVTFTNKAAREMSERVAALTEGRSTGIWLGTFHSIAARILRQHAEILGFSHDFTIIDTNDQLRLIKQIFAEHNIDEKKWDSKSFLAIISRLKDQGLTPEKVTAANLSDFAGGRLLNLYKEYQQRLLRLNAVDFGDLLLHNLTLFMEHPEILAQYHNQFRYILVDEYQDTNIAQYLWLRLLAEKNKNICCVGDDDQSIYGWRGAEVGNILRFEKDFSGAEVIRLERNYRSTSHILKAASGLIAKNEGRLGKTLWTEGNEGVPLKLMAVWDDNEEAQKIADEIDSLQSIHSQKLKEVAILVRAGFQTRSFEECFISRGIAYRVVGGLRFYERQEIKDLIAYMRIIVQNNDDLAFERIINVPKRGLGDATIESIRKYARTQGFSMLSATRTMISEGAFKPKIHEALAKLTSNFERWKNLFTTATVSETIDIIARESGYINMWREEKTPDSEGRLENIKELIRALEEFESVQQFLEHVSLVTDIDMVSEDNMVSIMTLHSAKGLEFETVFLPGWEEGLFPHQRSLGESGLAGLEEERRLAYVGITRAKKRAYILYAANRRVYGQYQSSLPSRFIDELPKENIEKISLNNGFNFGGFNSSVYEAEVPKHKESTAYYDNNIAPAKKSAFNKGERVFHVKFGYGIIRSIDGNKLTINFEKADEKTVISDYVNKA